MDESCLNSQSSDLRVAAGEVDAPRSCSRAIPLGVIGGANSHMGLSSPIAPPLIQDRKTGAFGKVLCSGELQADVDYSQVSNYCSVAPFPPIAEEGDATPTYDTMPFEPLAAPASPALSLQTRTHILSIGGDSTEPPLSVFTDTAIWSPTWPESHHEDVDSTENSVVDISDLFLPEFQTFWGRGDYK